jgi:hypothetical protein
MGEMDAKICEELFQRMKDHPKLDTAHFKVEVTNGAVHLKGKADTEEEKALAGRIAEEFPGVVSVKNDLHVDLGFIHALTSIVSGISASNDEELHHPPGEEKKEGKEKPDPD